MVEHDKMVIEMDQAPVRRGRGRPRKPPGEKKSHDAAFYADIRLRRELATIKHKQFRLQEEDVAEAERLLKHLTDKATAAFHEITREINETVWGDREESRARDATGKFLRAEEPVNLPDDFGVALEPAAEAVQANEPQERSLSAVPDKTSPEAPQRPERRSLIPIKERGKLRLNLKG